MHENKRRTAEVWLLQTRNVYALYNSRCRNQLPVNYATLLIKLSPVPWGSNRFNQLSITSYDTRELPSSSLTDAASRPWLRSAGRLGTLVHIKDLTSSEVPRFPELRAMTVQECQYGLCLCIWCQAVERQPTTRPRLGSQDSAEHAFALSFTFFPLLQSSLPGCYW